MKTYEVTFELKNKGKTCGTLSAVKLVDEN
jgi:hypothetical protein